MGQAELIEQTTEAKRTHGPDFEMTGWSAIAISLNAVWAETKKRIVFFGQSNAGGAAPKNSLDWTGTYEHPE